MINFFEFTKILSINLLLFFHLVVEISHRMLRVSLDLLTSMKSIVPVVVHFQYSIFHCMILIYSYIRNNYLF